MDPRQLLRPLPLLVALLFFVVAGAEFVLRMRNSPAPIPQLVTEGSWSFVPNEPVFDFGSGGKQVEETPGGGRLLLDNDQWEVDRHGVWIMKDGAALEVDLNDHDLRSIGLESRSSRGDSPVREIKLSVNGVDCGAVETSTSWSVHEIEVGPGIITGGRTRVEFHLPDRVGRLKPRRAVLLRRLGFFDQSGDPGRVMMDGDPVIVNPRNGSVVIRRSGTLRVAFVMHPRVDALVVAYRFGDRFGRAEMVVEKSATESAAAPAAVSFSLSAETALRGRIRVPLHGHKGEFEIRVEAEIGEATAPLTLTTLRLIDEDAQPSD